MPENLARLVRGAAISKGYTLGSLAHELKMHPTTLSRKLSRKGACLTVEDVSNIAKILEMSNETAQEIFFTPLLADTQG